MLYSLYCLSNFKLMVPLVAASNFVMDARLELFITSTMVRPATGEDVAEDDDEKVLEMPLISGESTLDEEEEDASGACAESCRVICKVLEPVCGAEIVSSKELNLVKFIIQPSIFLSSASSVTFCQETFNVVDETASTMTSSG